MEEVLVQLAEIKAFHKIYEIFQNGVGQVVFMINEPGIPRKRFAVFKEKGNGIEVAFSLEKMGVWKDSKAQILFDHFYTCLAIIHFKPYVRTGGKTFRPPFLSVFQDRPFLHIVDLLHRRQVFNFKRGAGDRVDLISRDQNFIDSCIRSVAAIKTGV